MKQDPFLSDLRVCISEEPKSGARDENPGIQQIDETGNVLSVIGSQGQVQLRVSAWKLI